LKKGDSLNYESTTEQKQSAKVNGMDFKTSMTQSMEITWTVKDVQDGNADVVQKINQLRQKLDMPGQGFEFDSKKGKKAEGAIGQLIGPIYDAMVGSEYSFKMDPQGETSDNKISEKLLQAVKTNPALAQLGEMFSEEGLKNMMQQSQVAFPKEAVSKGKSWNKKVEMKMPFGTMKIDTNYTYQGPETRNNTQLEKIDSKSTVTMEPAADAKISLKVKSADVKGTIYFDNKAGKLVEISQTQKMVMETSVMGQTFESNQEQTTTLKLVK
jgi:hypothetical protein